MLQVSNLSIHFGGRYLFDSVSYSINTNDRIGLIGRNGTGKTTMLRILCNLESSENGTVSHPNEYTIGYLPQEGIVNSDKTVAGETATALSELRSLEELVTVLTTEISSRTDYESKEYHKLIERLTEANDHYKILGGHSSEADIEKILLGLGFRREDLTRPVKHFSGGWQMRIELAKILVRRPNLIMLDEPTNHLDIESIAWLEDFLKNYEYSVIIVSHDKKFLDNITTRTMELSGGKLYDANLPYSAFLELRSEQRAQLEASFKAQQKEIRDTERFIERFRSKANLATRVQSRVKQLDKLERIEIEEVDTSAIHFRFPEPPRSGRVLAEAIALSKSYGDNHVLDRIDFAIERGEKVAFVGKNGEGKSTFSRILAGQEDYDGTLNAGSNVELGYFDQHQAELLDPNSTVFDIIDSTATGDMRTRVRSLLGAFLFSGDDVYKKARVLSGGEKSRLSIARLLLRTTNLLILDEPTNHLDMLAKNVLKNALMNYEGTLIVVSHDRDFLSGLTNRTVHFRDKKIREIPGDIQNFLDKMRLDNLALLEKNVVAQSQVTIEQAPSVQKLDREQQKSFSARGE